MAADLEVYRSDSPRAACVVGHGAGAGRNSPFMVRFATGMAERGVSTATFDFPYMAAKRGAPDKPAVLEASWRTAVEEAQVRHTRKVQDSASPTPRRKKEADQAR